METIDLHHGDTHEADAKATPFHLDSNTFKLETGTKLLNKIASSKNVLPEVRKEFTKISVLNHRKYLGYIRN